MSEHDATVTWERGGAAFTDNRYSRRHRWAFDGGAEVAASASPSVVPVPLSDPAAVDPEEAFVAALSSCHMLWFLGIAAKRGVVVERYVDDATGVLGIDDRGREAITTVTLRPRVTLAGGHRPGRDAVAAMHHEAHERCFLANAVRCAVECEPRYDGSET